MPVTQVEWEQMTEVLRNISVPNSFLRKLLFPTTTERLLWTETVELSAIVGGRKMAPFVKRGSQALLVGGLSSVMSTIATPNIRIKQPFQPTNFMSVRLPGTPTQVSESEMGAAVNQAIALHIEDMYNSIDNTIEWMIGQLLTGAITYASTGSDEESFTVTLPRAAGNSITLSTFWDTGGANARPMANIATAKSVVSDLPGAEGTTITDAICGSEAQAALMGLVEAGHVKVLDMKQIDPGSLSFVQNVTAEGATYLGTLAGVRFWGYGRQATDYNGVVRTMIRPKWVEFINANPVISGREMYFGAIPDWDIFKTGSFRGRVLAKSWTETDPPNRFHLIHTRPLPWSIRPNTTVSMKVVSG